jgi:mRNA-degrading endonuclease RelE of RelBE toxin-antitoxin system
VRSIAQTLGRTGCLDKLYYKTIIIVMVTPRQPFEVIYASQVKQHLRAIERRHYGFIRRTIETQLQFEPDVETRNRKPLKRSVGLAANWELRCGPQNRFRVFYDVDHECHMVYILAIGVKQGDRLFIGGEEIT